MPDPDYQTLRLAYARSADQSAASPVRHRVVIAGAGPVGLALAIDLAQRGVAVVLLDDDDTLSTGSRAICFAKRTLEIFDRLGCGERMLAKGVSWNVGKVFFRDAPVYSFNLLAEAGHRFPAFINLQQYYVEGFLLDRAGQSALIDIRWKHRVTGLDTADAGVAMRVETPDGEYALEADYLLACDGARSAIRGFVGAEAKGHSFHDHFLIADVKMEAEFPSERWFWFDPPFHPNQSVLLHRQPDNVWRIDFQLGADADPVAERQPERVTPRIQALLGPDVAFTHEWMSVYTFACKRIERFRHGRVIFAGDAAHGVSPFGARGANSGIQDADNLAWKLKLVLDGAAPDALLDSYGDEREYAADENIRASTRSTDFISPKSEVSRHFRNAVLMLARDCAFARRLVNSGRLSVPAVLSASPLNTPDEDSFAGAMRPGAASTDAPIRDGWFLRAIGGGFTGLYFTGGKVAIPADDLHALAAGAIPIRPLLIAPPGTNRSNGIEVLEDTEGKLTERFDATPGTFYLLRPDQHVAARWRQFDPSRVRQALARATCTA